MDVSPRGLIKMFHTQNKDKRNVSLRIHYLKAVLVVAKAVTRVGNLSK